MIDWIRIDEEEPDENVYILIYGKDGFYRIGFLNHGDWCFDGRYYDFSFITHWMPLPNTPEQK